jgi:hypothetical protein
VKIADKKRDKERMNLRPTAAADRLPASPQFKTIQGAPRTGRSRRARLRELRALENAPARKCRRAIPCAGDFDMTIVLQTRGEHGAQRGACDRFSRGGLLDPRGSPFYVAPGTPRMSTIRGNPLEPKDDLTGRSSDGPQRGLARAGRKYDCLEGHPPRIGAEFLTQSLRQSINDSVRIDAVARPDLVN